MVESIVNEQRPDTFQACANCPFADKATERAKREVLSRDDLDQVASVTITITCEGGNLSKGILRVDTDINGVMKGGRPFLSYRPGENVPCPGIREERPGLMSSE
jgi:hypothetical protein